MDAVEIFCLLAAGGLALTLALGAVLLFDRRGRDRPDRSFGTQRPSSGREHQSVRPLGPADDRSLP